MEISVAATSKLQAIAEMTGVTPQKVQDVILNNNVLIPDATYRAIIGALMDQGEGTFDCVVFKSDKVQRIPARLTNDYIGNLIKGMNEAAAQSPYHVSYHIGNRHIITPELYDALLLKYPKAGMISLIPHNIELITEVCERHDRPCVLVDFEGKRLFERDYLINVSNRKSIKMVMNHLFELGHRRIAFITGMMSMTSAVERLKGYEESLAEKGIAYDPALVVTGNWLSDQAREQTRQLVALPERPTAIVASNDVMASGVIITLKEYGLQIPADVSVVGFDDIPMADDISLTTIRQPIAMIGKQAFDLMSALLDGQKVSQHEYELPADLIIRGTTGRAPN